MNLLKSMKFGLVLNLGRGMIVCDIVAGIEGLLDAIVTIAVL